MRLTRPVPLMAPLVSARVVMGASQSDVAGAIGVSTSHISHLETGVASPRVNELSAYAQYVGLNMNLWFSPVLNPLDTEED